VSATSSLAGRKRERFARSAHGSKGLAAPKPSALDRLAEAQAACGEALRSKSYRLALNDIAVALERIFSAKLVILRDGAVNEAWGVAPPEIDPRIWIDIFAAGRGGGVGTQTFLVEEGAFDAPDSSIGRFIVVPLHDLGSGALWLGLGKRANFSADDLTCLTLLGEYLSLALTHAATARSRNGTHEVNGSSAVAAPALSDADELIAIAAHELRTPLTPMTMLLQSMERKAKTAGGELEPILRTRRQVQRLTAMISDLLDLSRLRRERLALTPVPVELGSTLSESVRKFREMDPRRHVELTISSEPLHVRADEQRLLQSLSNLLDHVARTSPSDAPIHVTLERRGGHASITMHADRPFLESTISPGEPLPPTRTTRHLGLAALLAEGVLRRFDGIVSIDGEAHREARAETTFPLLPEQL